MAKIKPRRKFDMYCHICGLPYSYIIDKRSIWCSGIFHRCRACVYDDHNQLVERCAACKADPLGRTRHWDQ